MIITHLIWLLKIHCSRHIAPLGFQHKFSVGFTLKKAKWGLTLLNQSFGSFTASE